MKFLLFRKLNDEKLLESAKVRDILLSAIFFSFMWWYFPAF